MQSEAAESVVRYARNLLKEQVDWVVFFKEVFGRQGLVNRTFPQLEQLSEFEQSEEYAQVQSMLAQLRLSANASDHGNEGIRVITIRLPESMHDALREEARNHRTSMNKLCISKLLQIVDQDLVPSDS